jgi:hypothetical protein
MLKNNVRCYVHSCGFSVRPPESVLIEMEVVIQSVLTGQALILSFDIKDPNWMINEEGLLTYTTQKIERKERDNYSLSSEAKDKETNQSVVLTDIEKELITDCVFSYCKEEIIHHRTEQENNMMTLFGMDDEDLDLLSEEEKNFLIKDFKK